MCSRPSSAGSTVRSDPLRASRRLCRWAEVSTGRRGIRPDRFEFERQQATAPTSSSSVVSGLSSFFGRKLGRELVSVNRIGNNDRPNRLSPGAQHAKRELCRNNHRVYAHARIAAIRVAPHSEDQLIILLNYKICLINVSSVLAVATVLLLERSAGCRTWPLIIAWPARRGSADAYVHFDAACSGVIDRSSQTHARLRRCRRTNRRFQRLSERLLRHKDQIERVRHVSSARKP
jgi:hypothetical protein